MSGQSQPVFVVEPESASVREGTTTFLYCQVNNTVGATVQWARGGFAMGDLTSYPRYEFSGAREHGELVA